MTLNWLMISNIPAANAENSDQVETPAAQERAEALRARVDSIKNSRNQPLLILGQLLLLAGVLFCIPWIPFGTFAACDPRETCQGFSEVVGRSLELTSGARFALLCTYIAVTLILIITLAMCLFPGIFFGMPLGFAWLSACYLVLRDGVSQEADPAPA